MILIKDILKPRKKLLKVNFKGVMQSHQVNSAEDRIESNPEKLFGITYMSSALKREH